MIILVWKINPNKCSVSNVVADGILVISAHTAFRNHRYKFNVILNIRLHEYLLTDIFILTSSYCTYKTLYNNYLITEN